MMAGLTNMTTVDSLGLTVKEGLEGRNVTDLTAGAATFESVECRTGRQGNLQFIIAVTQHFLVFLDHADDPIIHT